MVASETGGPEPAPGWPRLVARSDLSTRVRRFLPSTGEALAQAVAQVRSIARVCGCSADRRTDLEIALREVLANAMLHGNQRLPERQVFLRCYGGPRVGLFICVRDEGAGFDPRAVPDPRTDDRLELPHGRGLLLMRSLSDAVLFRRGGRDVVLYFAHGGAKSVARVSP